MEDSTDEHDLWKRLIILDLNGVLIARQYVEKGKDAPEDGDKLGNFVAQKRPHLDTFLKFLFDNFTVAYWSSIAYYNTKQFGEYAFGEHYKKLLFMWDQTKCWSFDHPTIDNKPLFLKPLAKVWKTYPQFNQGNTLLIDDSPAKACFNPEGTLFVPDIWKYGESEDEYLSPKGKLVDLLTGLSVTGVTTADYLKIYYYTAPDTTAIADGVLTALNEFRIRPSGSANYSSSLDDFQWEMVMQKPHPEDFIPKLLITDIESDDDRLSVTLTTLPQISKPAKEIVLETITEKWSIADMESFCEVGWESDRALCITYTAMTQFQDIKLGRKNDEPELIVRAIAHNILPMRSFDRSFF